MHKILCAATAFALAAGAVTTSTTGAQARQQSRPARAAAPATSVTVTSDGTHVRVSRTSVDAGYIGFRVRATNATMGSDIVLFRPKAHATLANVLNGFKEEFSTNPKVSAKGTRDLTRDAWFSGLAQVEKSSPATVTQYLKTGSYYLFDLSRYPAVPLHVTRLTVRWAGATHHRPPAYSATVKLTSSDRFATPGTLAAKGTVRVRNVSDTLHFMALMRVKKGTTDAQVQKYFDSGAQGPPPFAQTGPGVGMGVQSPGRQARLTYDVPPGTYVMLCFVGDDKTGMPHALMGMHHVVTLK
jgi:hypothetical protein